MNASKTDAGGGDPAGGRTLPLELEAACVCASLHRRANADPVGAYEAALCGITLLAVPAFERALIDDMRREWMAKERDRRARAAHGRTQTWISRRPIKARPVLRAAAKALAAGRLGKLVRAERGLNGKLLLLDVYRRKKGNQSRTALTAFVLTLAEVWRVITGESAQRRFVGDGRHSASEVFILHAARGVFAIFCAMPGRIRSADAEKQLRSLTLNGVADRLKPRIYARKLPPRN